MCTVFLQGVAAVLSEGVLGQNGPKWSKRPLLSKLPYFKVDFGIRETKLDQQDGPFWLNLVKRSILFHLCPPTVLWPLLILVPPDGLLGGEQRTIESNLEPQSAEMCP